MSEDDNEQDYFFLRQNLQMNERKESEEFVMQNQLGVAADVEGSPLRGERPSSIMASENGVLDDIDESGRITKVLMPNERQINGVFDDGSKMIGDYKIEKTLGQGTFGKVK